jgi:hypothetical protein
MDKRDDDTALDYVTITTPSGTVIKLGDVKNDDPGIEILGVATGELYDGDLSFDPKSTP